MKKSIQTLLAISSASLMLAGQVAHAEVMSFATPEEAEAHVLEMLGSEVEENKDYTLVEDEEGNWTLTYGPEFEATRGDAQFLVLNPVDDTPAAGVTLLVEEGMDQYEVVTDENGIAYFKNLDPEKDYVAHIEEAPEGMQFNPEFIHPFRVVEGDVTDFTYGVLEEEGEGLEMQDLVFDTADEARQAGFEAYKGSDDFIRYRVDMNEEGKWFFTLENELTEDNESGFTHYEDADQAAYDDLQAHPEFKHYSLNKVEGKWYYELTEELNEDNKTGYTSFDDAVAQAELMIKEEPRFVDYTVDEVEGKFYYTLFESKEEAEAERDSAFEDAKIDSESEKEDVESVEEVEVSSQETTEKVPEKKENKGALPDTGESSSLFVIAIGLVAAIAGFLVLALPRLKNKRQ